MNTKTTKMLAVLATLAFAFAVFAIATPAETQDAAIGVEGLYHYDSEGELVIVTETSGSYTLSDSETLYAYTPDADKIVAIDYNIVVPAGKTATIASYEDSGYTVQLAAQKYIQIDTATSALVINGADLDIVDEVSTDSAFGATGIKGGAATSTAAQGTVTVKNGSALYLGLKKVGSTGSDVSMGCTANLIVEKGAKLYAAQKGSEVGVGNHQLIGDGEDIAAILMTGAGNISITMKSLTERNYTLNANVTVDSDKALNGVLIAAGDNIVVPEGITATVVKTNAIPYESKVTNNGTIKVTGEMVFATSSTSSDVSDIGLQGDGVVNVVSGGKLILPFGTAVRADSPSTAMSALVAIGFNEINVASGGKLFFADNSLTTKYMGVVGDDVATASTDIYKADLPTKFIYKLGTGASFQLTANALETETSEGKAQVYGADYVLKGTVTVGVSHVNSKFTFLDRYDTLTIASGTTTINANVDIPTGYSGPTIIIADGAKLDLATADNHNQTFALATGATIYVKGTLDLTNGAKPTVTQTTVEGQYVILGGTMKYYDSAASPTILSTIVYQSGKVIAKGAAETDLTPTTPGSVGITTYEALETAIDEGASKITVNNDVTITDGSTIPSGVTLSIPSNYTLTVPDGKALELETGATVSGKVTVGGKTVTFTDFSGAVTISKGSVKINGVIASGTIDLGNEVKTGNDAVVLTGSLNGKLTIISTSTDAAQEVIFENFTINSTGTLELTNNNQVSYAVKTSDANNKYYMYVYGTIVPKDTGAGTTKKDVSIEVPIANNTYKSDFIAYGTSQISGLVTITGGGNINLSEAQRTQYVDQDIAADKTYGQSEKVIVIGSLSIGNNSTVTIKGGLIVNEGVTLTIENGSTLVVNSVVASVIVDGKIIVEDGGSFTVTAAKGVDIAGSLVSEGTVTIGPATTVKSGGIIDIKDDANSTSMNGGLTIAAGGTVNLRSNISINGIVNKGTVNIPEATMNAAVTINQAASGAKVVVGILGAKTSERTFTVTDNGLKFAGTDALTGDDSVSDYPNNFTFTLATTKVVGGFTISENVTTYVDGTDTYYSNYMILDGIVACYAVATDDPDELAVSLSGPKFVQVNGEFALGESVTLNTTANIDVNGDLYATATDSRIVGSAGAAINAYGKVTILSAKFAGVDPYVNGTMYKITVEGTSYNVYTTFEDAIAAAVLLEKDTVYVYGNNYVNSTMIVPEGLTVKKNTVAGVDATITIGSIDNTAVVTVKDGAVVKDTTIYVDGTLIFENYRNNKQNTIYSDVYVKNGDMQKYTNVYAAIAGASDGDTVTTTADVTVLKNNLTIPAGVTLNVPASKVLKVAPGTTLTVNGVLQTSEPVLVDTSVYEGAVFGTTASLISDPETACIAVNGIFKSMAKVQYDGDTTKYKIPGAYYAFADSTGAYNYVSPVAVAVTTSASSMEIFGEVTTGDVAWAGTSSTPKSFVINSAAKLVSGTLSFSYVNFDNNGTYTGSLVYSDAKVTATKVSELTVFNTDGADTILYVSSVTIPSKCSFTVDSGSVALGAVTGDMKIASGAIVTVPNTANTTVNGTLTVNGTFHVENGKQATITTLNDLGSVIVDPATTTVAEGILTVTTGYVGMTKDNIDKGIAAAATLSGPVNATVLYVSGSATLDDDAKASLENKVSVTFIAGKATWFVVYGNNGFTVAAPVFAPVEDAILTSWNTKADGSGTATEAGATITVTADKTLYAIVETAIYQVTIITDSGIKSVAIDNIEMIRDGASNIFYSYDEDHGLGVLLEAGTHTVKYTLYNGYEGTAQLYTMDNTVLKDLKFTVSGTDLEDLVNSYQLYGTEQIVTPEPSPVEQNEWTITTILLVILVILIAIMAVIVALRLNRS